MVNGCFWHQHRRCRLARTPKSRLDYWAAKLARNSVRDKVSVKRLRYLGWKVLVVWECETGDVSKLRKRLTKFLESSEA
jgi:DNA mismatch endonuclease (patch repair protein)